MDVLPSPWLLLLGLGKESIVGMDLPKNLLEGSLKLANKIDFYLEGLCNVAVSHSLVLAL